MTVMTGGWILLSRPVAMMYVLFFLVVMKLLFLAKTII